MTRYNFYIRGDQLTFLKHLSGAPSEHIRHAIDQYIKKLGYIPGYIPTTSPSVTNSLTDYLKGGEKYGKQYKSASSKKQ